MRIVHSQILKNFDIANDESTPRTPSNGGHLANLLTAKMITSPINHNF